MCAERRREPGAVGLLEADDVADVADLLFVVVIYEERDGLAVRKKAQRIGSVELRPGRFQSGSLCRSSVRIGATLIRAVCVV